MNFLKKIFFKGESVQAVAPVKLPYREPRILLTDLHKISMQVSRPAGISRLVVDNISSRGMGIRLTGAESLKEGMEIQGTVLVERKEFEVKAVVRHITDWLVGCELSQTPPDFKRSLEDYLRVEILGLTLNKVNESILKPDPQGKVNWFTDSKQNEVYCITDDSGVVSFHISFVGNYIEGGRGKALRCGYVREEKKSTPSYKASSLIDVFDEISPEMLELARALVQNIGPMPSELKDRLSALLSA